MEQRQSITPCSHLRWPIDSRRNAHASQPDCTSSPNSATLAVKVMNPIHAALAVLLTTITCFAQGQVNFANRVGAGGSILNAPVTILGTTDGPGSDWTAQLLLQNADGSLSPLMPISTFNPAGTGAAAIPSQFWAPKTVDIPGHFAGESLTFHRSGLADSVG